MNFSNKKLIKIVPEAFGNKESDKPCACYVEKMSLVETIEFLKMVKEENLIDNASLFNACVVKIENFFLEDDETGDIKELTRPEEVVDIPGIAPLVEEVLVEFNNTNNFGGSQKK